MLGRIQIRVRDVHGSSAMTVVVGGQAMAPGVVGVEAHAFGQTTLDGSQQRVIGLRSAVVNAIHKSIESAHSGVDLVQQAARVGSGGNIRGAATAYSPVQ